MNDYAQHSSLLQGLSEISNFPDATASLLTLTKISWETNFNCLDEVVECDAYFPNLREMHIAFSVMLFRSPPNTAITHFINRHQNQVVFYSSTFIISHAPFQPDKYPLEMWMYFIPINDSPDSQALKIPLGTVPFIWSQIFTSFDLQQHDSLDRLDYMYEIEEVEFKMLILDDWHSVNEAIDDLLNAGFSFQRLDTVNMDVHGGSGSVYDFSPQLRKLKNK